MKHKKWVTGALIVTALLCAALICRCGGALPGGRARDEEETNSFLALPILDEIAKNTSVGTAGSFMTAVQSAVKLLDWGVNTGLDPEEIKDAAAAYLADKDRDEREEFVVKLVLVDEAYKKLLEGDEKDLLSSAGCSDAAYLWGDEPVESVEAIMDAAGLRE